MAHVVHNRQVIPKEEVVYVLAGFCREWQQMVEDVSLIEVNASVGLILADLAIAFGLSRQDQIAVLGDQLSREFFYFLDSNPYRLKR